MSSLFRSVVAVLGVVGACAFCSPVAQAWEEPCRRTVECAADGVRQQHASGPSLPAGDQSPRRPEHAVRATLHRRSHQTRSPPAIVLVHGIASSTENWDFSPTWSVARALASAGYVVFSYDRLGYARSDYFDHPGGGYAAHHAGTSGHAARRGDRREDRRVPVSLGRRLCRRNDARQHPEPHRGDHRPQRGRVDRGRLSRRSHDVAAMIQTDISGSAGGSAAPPLGVLVGRGLHAGLKPPRLLPVLPDHAGVHGVQHLRAGAGAVRREDRLQAALPGLTSVRSPTLASSTRRTTPTSR